MNNYINSEDDKREQLLQVIYDFWRMSPDERFPATTLNHFCGICGDDAMELILECEEFLGAPRWDLYVNFPFDTYFDPEVPPIWEQMLGGLLLPLLILINLYCVFKSYYFRLLNIEIKKDFNSNDNGKPPLTALHFANLMIDLWNQYQE